MNRTTWSTYAISGYTGGGQDQRAAGGVVLHEVRRTRTGYWQRRHVNSNGRHEEVLGVEPLDAPEGEALWARAESY
jgi:hypothetical protein